MKILLIDNGTKLLKDLESFVPEATIVHAPGSLADIDLAEYDLAILSGGSGKGALDAAWTEELAFIRGANIPILGICLGFELVALAFGGTLKRLPHEHQGFSFVKVVSDDAIFLGRHLFSAYEHHRVALASLPPAFRTLAVSGEEISAIRHERWPIYAFQFHPEYNVGKSGAGWILDNFIHTYVKA